MGDGRWRACVGAALKKTHPKVREGCNAARVVNKFDMQRHHRSAITVDLEPLEYPSDVDHYMSNCGLAIRLATSGSLLLGLWQDGFPIDIKFHYSCRMSNLENKKIQEEPSNPPLLLLGVLACLGLVFWLSVVVSNIASVPLGSLTLFKLAKLLLSVVGI